VDRHCFDADLDLTFHVDADPDWHQKDAGPHSDSTSRFTHNEKKIFIFIYIHNNPVYNDFPFSSVAKVS
jgi:hypothetical protein